MTKKASTLLALLATLALAIPATAWANAETFSDGNDVAGPLDIRSVSMGHAGGRMTHTLRTFDGFSGRLLDGNSLVAFAFDTNDTASSIERLAVVFWANGSLRCVVINRRGNAVGRCAVSRPNRRAVKVKLSRRSLGRHDGYRWGALAIARSHADIAPNHRLVLHDITAPTITFPTPAIPTGMTYDVAFTVRDSGGAGLEQWKLQRRTFGETSWSTFASGDGEGSHAVSITAAEGDDDQYRVVAVDRQENRRISRVATVSIPVDDANAAITYLGPTWSHATGVPGAFLTTLSSAADAEEGFTYGFSGSYVALVGTGTCARGQVTIEDADGHQDIGFLDDPCNDRPRQILYRKSLSPGTYTVTVGWDGGSTLSFDGIIVR